MKRVSRTVDFATLLVFLIALSSNCIQASRVTVDTVLTTGPVLSDSNSPIEDPFDLPLADDYSDETPILFVVQNPIAAIQAVESPRIFGDVSILGVKHKQPTVLRI